MVKYPKILVLSNECLANDNSNGRTLRNLLKGWPVDRVAQFYIKDGNPDYSVCNKYYKVSDKDVVKAFLGKKKTGEVVQKNENNVPYKSSWVKRIPKRYRRNAVTMFVRNFIWESYRWYGRELENWVKSFGPNVILLQAGDSSFMFSFAIRLAKMCRAPLVVYNSEGYYFKKHDYFRSNGISHLVYPLFHKIFCKKYEEMMGYTDYVIYNCSKLEEEYNKYFKLPSIAIYTSTELAESEYNNLKDMTAYKITYLGNLGVGRHVPLIEIASKIHKVNANYYLDIYGTAPSKDVIEKLIACEGVRYHGKVPYEKVIEIMKSSDLLVHAECFESFYREDLKFAFSTKIADSLAIGVKFLLYAPEELACTEYLKNARAAYVVTTSDELSDVLRQLIGFSDIANVYKDNAKKLVAMNHEIENNALKFRKIITEVVGLSNESNAN